MLMSIASCITTYLLSLIFLHTPTVSFAQQLNQHIQGAIILTDPGLSSAVNERLIKKNQRLDNGTYYDQALKRIENGRKFASSLPFAVQEWWSVKAGPCPNLARDKTIAYGKSRGNDRGVAMAHMQIIDNFLYEQRNGFNKSTNDLLVIFEDDVVSAVTDLTWSLNNEFKQITHDFIFLGWCPGPKKFPLCFHAYVLTSRGAEIVRAGYDACGTAIDGQFLHLFNKKTITFRKALKSSYVKSLKPGFDEGYWTKGIVVQEKGIASFNYHWWNKEG